jgi:hypothetical protein
MEAHRPAAATLGHRAGDDLVPLLSGVNRAGDRSGRGGMIAFLRALARAVEVARYEYVIHTYPKRYG